MGIEKEVGHRDGKERNATQCSEELPSLWTEVTILENGGKPSIVQGALDLELENLTLNPSSLIY